jgi:hypothetical protein
MASRENSRDYGKSRLEMGRLQAACLMEEAAALEVEVVARLDCRRCSTRARGHNHHIKQARIWNFTSQGHHHGFLRYHAQSHQYDKINSAQNLDREPRYRIETIRRPTILHTLPFLGLLFKTRIRMQAKLKKVLHRMGMIFPRNRHLHFHLRRLLQNNKMPLQPCSEVVIWKGEHREDTLLIRSRNTWVLRTAYQCVPRYRIRQYRIEVERLENQ